MSGGFIGVDVFFVLSGYLVTQLLLRDLTGERRIDLARFYARRYRRLLPAAFVVLVVSAASFALVATASEVSDAVGAFRSSFLYVANWHFIRQSSDYFADDVANSPVIHFWSLAVEEQFYLLWPLLLGAVFSLTRRFGERRTAVVRVLVGLGGIASAGAALHIARSDVSRAYYGTDTRGYQLLAGALLALTPALFGLGGRVRGLLAATGAVAIAAIAALATSWLHLGVIQRGIATTVATGLVIVSIESAPSALASRLLAQRAMSYLGRLSYGIYLWHWPVLVVMTRETSLDAPSRFAVTSALATAAAAASYHALELRVRLSHALDARRLQVIGAGLALSLLGGIVVAPGILSLRDETTLRATGVDGGDPAVLDWQAAKKDNPPLPKCSLEELVTCTVVPGVGPRVLLLGDSNARMYIPTFTKIAEREHLELSVAVAPLCPWQRGLNYLKGGAACRQIQDDWYGGLIDRLDPDLIVVAHRPVDDPANPVPIATPDGAFAPGSVGYDAALRQVSTEALAILGRGGAQVVIIEPIPIAAKVDDPLACISSADALEDCVYSANRTATPIERAYRRAAEPGQVWSVDLDRLVCPRLPTCDPVVDGLIVKRDSNHITGTYAAHLSEAVEARLREIGVLR